MGNNEVRAKLDELHRRMTLWLAEPDAPSTTDLVNAVTLIEEDEQSQPAPGAGEEER